MSAPRPEAVTDAERSKWVEKIAAALDVDPAKLTGPSPDGLPDHWSEAAPFPIEDLKGHA